MEFKKPLLNHVYHHVKCGRETLASQNNKGKTALQLFDAYNFSKNQYIEKIESLLNGEKLKNDLRVFNKAFPNLLEIPKNNLIYKIYNNGI